MERVERVLLHVLSVVWPASDCAGPPLRFQIGQRFRPQVVEVRADLNARTNIRIINGSDGAPAFVVIPYADYMAQHEEERDLTPHEVISATVDGATPLRAWREHLKLTQADIAARPGISQSAYAQQERSEKLRKSTREKIAAALGITAAQLDF
ncbi:DNA-binding protein [Burkholderia diffusa]|uniref:DNA-binding protein n=1 Tax=Burkholderia diffusa TaxID=488732 RepID=A0A6P2INQ8_9BURK|nr:DNA-binding protein [Burkholderia diffusa]